MLRPHEIDPELANPHICTLAGELLRKNRLYLLYLTHVYLFYLQPAVQNLAMGRLLTLIIRVNRKSFISVGHITRLFLTITTTKKTDNKEPPVSSLYLRLHQLMLITGLKPNFQSHAYNYYHLVAYRYQVTTKVLTSEQIHDAEAVNIFNYQRFIFHNTPKAIITIIIINQKWYAHKTISTASYRTLT